MQDLLSNHTDVRRVILNHLSSEFEATFLKVNGDERDMRFVLCDPSLTLDEPAVVDNLEDHDNMRLVVWDLDADGWRSIKLDRVLDLRPV